MRLRTATLGGWLLLQTALGGAQTAPEEPGGIQDNSFLIEEAYNQEPGVVQHINTFSRSFDSHDWVYSFTQEWPVPGIKHQLSYSIPLMRVTSDAGAGTGVGDVALNYRYQLVGDGEAHVAVAPRFTVLVPTGSDAKGRGAGAVGYQVDLPLSLTLGKRFATHFNAGLTFTPSARNTAGEKADTTAWNLGHSLVFLASPRFNLLVETVLTRGQDVVAAGRTETGTEAFVVPGLRWAYNFKSGLQIVPGLAFPIGLADSRGDHALFLYLSFEHPFRKLK